MVTCEYFKSIHNVARLAMLMMPGESNMPLNHCCHCHMKHFYLQGTPYLSNGLCYCLYPQLYLHLDSSVDSLCGVLNAVGIDPEHHSQLLHAR